MIRLILSYEDDEAGVRANAAAIIEARDIHDADEIARIARELQGPLETFVRLESERLKRTVAVEKKP